MSDESDPFLPQPTPDPRTITSMSERLAVVETQQRVVKDDLNVVRATLHSINNEMQKFVAAEQRCVDNLNRLLEITRDLPMFASSVASFSEMRPELRAMLMDRERKSGLADFGKRFSMILMAGAALVGMLGGIAAGLVWLVQHLRP